VQLPNVVSPAPDSKTYDESREDIGGYGAAAAGIQPSDIKFSIVQRIFHPGEINRARYMPQKPDIIATTCVDARILIWDRTKHSIAPKDLVEAPQIELIGHKQEGFGLNWNPHVEGRLVTGSEDKTVKLW
jgi:histone-binding protein RBBP4